MSNPFARSAYASAPSGSTARMDNGPSNSGVSVDFTAARADISDAMAGRISLAMLNLIILGMVGFYVWTRNAQGGG